MQTHFTYAVVGAGAIGSYYGGKLAQHGREVRFLMRADLEAVKARGLELVEDCGTACLPIRPFGSPEEIGPVDVVLIGLKATANHALQELIPPLLKPDTVLVTLQNGLGNEEFLAQRFGPERVLGGLGELNRPCQERTRQIVADFAASGIEARAVESLILERWRKLVWNVPFNGLSIAAGNIPTGKILANENLRQLTRELMEEVVFAAGRLGHQIPPSFVDEQIARTAPMGDYKPSSLIDHMAGRPVEVEAIWGEPSRQARAAGAEMIRVETLYRLLKGLTA